MVEFTNSLDFAQKANMAYFYERLYSSLIEDGNNISYGDFCSRILANGCVSVLKSLGLYKVTGARETKKAYIHEKVLLIYNTTVAENEIISKTIIDLIDGKFSNIDNLLINNLDKFYELSDDYPCSVDGSSCTYIIYNPNNNLYKIGKSKNVFHRLNQLRVAIFNNLEMCCWCDLDLEGKLHKEYKNKRVFGEWFSLDKDDILDIKNKYNFTILYLTTY